MRANIINNFLWIVFKKCTNFCDSEFFSNFLYNFWRKSFLLFTKMLSELPQVGKLKFEDAYLLFEGSHSSQTQPFILTSLVDHLVKNLAFLIASVLLASCLFPKLEQPKIPEKSRPVALNSEKYFHNLKAFGNPAPALYCNSPIFLLLQTKSVGLFPESSKLEPLKNKSRCGIKIIKDIWTFQIFLWSFNFTTVEAFW